MPGELVAFEVSFVPDRDFFVTAWSGSFALRIVYDVLHRAGLDFEKRERKPFIVEPLVDSSGNYMLTGFYVKRGERVEPHPEYSYRVVKKGEPFKVVVHFLDDWVAKSFMYSLVTLDTLREPACDLYMSGLNLRVEELPGPYPPPKELVFYRVSFLSPTAFTFHGLDVLYPSPPRLLYSALKNYSETTGVDTSSAAQGVAKLGELVWFRARRVLVDIGEGRKVPSFTGEAMVAVYGSRDGGVVAAALESASTLGVGISRTLGFGRVKVEPALKTRQTRETQAQTTT